jgi:Calcineurin-like phosphoesterase
MLWGMQNVSLAVLLAAAMPILAAEPAWIAYGPDGPIARTIVTSGDCPSIEVDGVMQRMRTRSLPGTGYPVTSCEAALPAGVRSASIGGTRLPVHKLGRTAKIALVGDTGCRLKAGNPPSIQDCSDPKQWPFAAVAASIAAWDPDLVLHVGDYYYREAVCSGTKCTKAPYDWTRWNADFFTPAAPLLGNAPWVMVRGNHEDCNRAAEGWFRFLDPRPYLWENAKTCQSNTDFTPPYVARAGDMRFIVFDSSALSENDPGQATMVAQWLQLYAKEQPGAWLMLHHPFWGTDETSLDTPTLWSAWSQAGAATSPISFVLTGHIHLLELLSFRDGRPPHAVVGNGGTELDDKAEDPTGQQFGPNGRTASSFVQDDGFGFIAATPTRDGWTFDIRDANGKSKTRCAMTEKGIVCD